jgi:UDP-N-acetylmuramate-alanine ligase
MISRIHKNVICIPELKDVVKYVDQKAFGRDYILVTMGAGNVYEISKEFIKQHE